MDPVLPELFAGRYRIEAPLGSGGSGDVWRATDLQTGQLVALKTIVANQTSTALKRFLREAEALGRLQHPAVVRLLDHGRAGQHVYLAMELIEGVSLEERLERGPLPVDQARRYGRALAQALARVHAQGLLHRDVKPANILLQRSPTGPRVRLIDFGLARAVAPGFSRTQLTQDGHFLGSPGYWAPEQAEGLLERIGPKTDVYGLGATLYRALTGELPHGEPRNLAEALLAWQQPVAPASARRPEIPPALDEAVLRCLAVEPDQRPSAAELAAALTTDSTSSGASSRGSAALPSAVSSQPGLLGLLAICAAVGIATGVGLVQALRPGPSDPFSPTPPPTAVAASPPPSSPPPSAAAGPRPASPAEPSAEAPTSGTEPGAATLATRAILALEAADFASAIALGEQALQLEPTNAQAAFAVGSGQYGQKHYAEALPYFDQAFELAGSDGERASAAYQRGRTLVQLRRFPAAVVDYRRVLALNRGYVTQAWHDLATCYLNLGQDRAGYQANQRGLARDPEHFQLRYQEVLILRRLSRYPEALERVTTLRRAKPRDVLLVGQQAGVLILLERAQEALTLLDEFLQLELSAAHRSLLLEERARALLDLDRFAEAEAIADDWIAAQPADPEPRRIKANCRIAQGDPQAALDLVEPALRDYPTNASLLWVRARALRHVGGRIDEAIAAYRAVLVQSPKSAVLVNNLADALLADGRLDEARATIRRSLALDPDLWVAHLTHAQILEQLGRLDEAWAASGRALELRSRSYAPLLELRQRLQRERSENSE